MPVTIVASTSSEDYIFEPCLTDTPVIQPMTASEVKEIHSKSKVFVDGWLTFEDEVKGDIYKYLRIKNGENILNQKEIMNCIISGRKDDVAKLINIQSKGYFERVYGVYTALKQTNLYDISMRVAKAIEYRYNELQKGIITTQIKLADTFTPDETDNRDKKIAEQEALLKEKDETLKVMNGVVANLEQKIEALTKLVSQVQTDNKQEEQKATSENKGETTPKKRGRPPKAKEE
jgi:hypothetical protein